MKFNTGLTLILLVTSAAATDYCRPGLCPRGRHVGCGNYGAFGPACFGTGQLYNLTEDDKAFIVRLHNERRQEIASGSLNRYESAAHMKEITWNDELAHVACFNAKTCVFAHDSCRNTDAHPYAGQNLAIVGQSQGYKPFREAYEDLHNQWFMEHQYCDMRNIRHFQNRATRPGQQIGHFTQMVSDNVDQVGCCVSMFTKNRMKFVYIVCNYSYTNISNRAIYTPVKV
ncbi:Antigen 5 like allergen Cul n 1 [Pseudolycoriella hygida]|uniref:Antigen 5 like allergen Cul n 1 n=1 Tax=Pseudolycoriella hygida TaxID=35572 RepID=A0A9Q0MSG9_9DIPT|nr:Antigen 5 like allergen Cul n 1 [Pseudolycoriella hygida]